MRATLDFGIVKNTDKKTLLIDLESPKDKNFNFERLKHDYDHTNPITIPNIFVMYNEPENDNTSTVRKEPESITVSSVVKAFESVKVFDHSPSGSLKKKLIISKEESDKYISKSIDIAFNNMVEVIYQNTKDVKIEQTTLSTTKFIGVLASSKLQFDDYYIESDFKTHFFEPLVKEVIKNCINDEISEIIRHLKEKQQNTLSIRIPKEYVEYKWYYELIVKYISDSLGDKNIETKIMENPFFDTKFIEDENITVTNLTYLKDPIKKIDETITIFYSGSKFHS